MAYSSHSYKPFNFFWPSFKLVCERNRWQNTFKESAVSFTGATGTISSSNGLAAIPRMVIDATSTLSTAALSIQDFNSFRLRVAAAINELDDKLRDLFALSSLTC